MKKLTTEAWKAVYVDRSKLPLKKGGREEAKCSEKLESWTMVVVVLACWASEMSDLKQDSCFKKTSVGRLDYQLASIGIINNPPMRISLASAFVGNVTQRYVVSYECK